MPKHPTTLHRRALSRLAALLCFAATQSTFVWAAESAPGQIVLSSTHHVLQVLDARRDEFKSNPAKLHQFIQSEFAQLFDRSYAARAVLGSAAASASDEDVQAFVAALGDDLLDRYGASLLKVEPSVHMRILSETSYLGGSMVKVATLVDRKAGSPVEVDYLVHRNASRWQAFDVVVEGVSLVQTFHIMFLNDARTKTLASITADLRNRGLGSAALPAVPPGRQQ